MTAAKHIRQLQLIIVLILIVAALQALAVTALSKKAIIVYLPERSDAPAPAAKPAEEVPAKRAKPDRSKISTNAASAGECAPHELRKHRSANPASRGSFCFSPSALQSFSPSAPAAGFHQLAGLSSNSARFCPWPRESNTAIHSAHAPAGQLRNLTQCRNVSAQNAGTVESATVLAEAGMLSALSSQLSAQETGVSFRFKPFGPIHTRTNARARRARAHARQHSASQHRGITCFATPATALVGFHPCPSVQSVVGSTARQEVLPA